jgi:hypothetical protein
VFMIADVNDIGDFLPRRSPQNGCEPGARSNKASSHWRGRVAASLMRQQEKKGNVELAEGLSIGEARHVRLQPSEHQVTSSQNWRQADHPRLWHRAHAASRRRKTQASRSAFYQEPS